MTEVKSIISHLKSLYTERDKLIEALEVSLEIQALWSDVFDNGTVTCQLTGKYDKLENLKLKIKNGVSEREFNLEDVPYNLRKRHLDLLFANDRHGSLYFLRGKCKLKGYI
jgi:hypothetical protein